MSVYVSQGNGGPVLLLGATYKRITFKFKLFCDHLSVCQFGLVSGIHLGTMTRFLLLQCIFGLHLVGRTPWLEDGSVICSHNSLSFLGPSLAELMTTTYCLIWDSPNPEGQVPLFIFPRSMVASYIPWHWVTFCHLLRLVGLRWWYSIPPASAYIAPRYLHLALLLWLVNLSLWNSFYPV
jgi:hypothetical protein